MYRALKRSLIAAVAALLSIGLAAVAYVYVASELIIERRHPLPPSQVRASAGPDAVAKGSKEEAQSSYRAAVPLIDTLVNKHLIHRNQADRHKSRLAARVKSLSS